MTLEKIISVGGKPGLYEVLTQTRTGVLAASLIDGKRITVSARENVSLLSEIAIYTLTEEMPLGEVFQKIFDHLSGASALSHKSSKDELEAFFFDVLPEYDEDRVYASDIKKVVQWYNLLIGKGVTDFSTQDESETNSEA
ncbi:MAG: DUF5606 domain-containing protein [Flavobacteriaceae bacterium]|jgi:hypothetical protein|nr:hypothetical protein [Flavobacteriaceae bacterium]